MISRQEAVLTVIEMRRSLVRLMRQIRPEVPEHVARTRAAALQLRELREQLEALELWATQPTPTDA